MFVRNLVRLRSDNANVGIAISAVIIRPIDEGIAKKEFNRLAFNSVVEQWCKDQINTRYIEHNDIDNNDFLRYCLHLNLNGSDKMLHSFLFSSLD